nr:immunoglobulin light chain junction region [Macaca mulatta]MOW57611.1 immunoglobulin light chain junction region [Macaca mulatta]MOW58700.1 immunoglobulin light chain junction region [Macaca mulatta]MOW61571.1 immunoglobulin light chain junction region [Macaca mulatta]
DYYCQSFDRSSFVF